jgi:hypothetical protein
MARSSLRAPSAELACWAMAALSSVRLAISDSTARRSPNLPRDAAAAARAVVSFAGVLEQFDQCGNGSRIMGFAQCVDGVGVRYGRDKSVNAFRIVRLEKRP